MWGGGVTLTGGHQPLMWALSGKNICKNERIGFGGGGDGVGGAGNLCM